MTRPRCFYRIQHNYEGWCFEPDTSSTKRTQIIQLTPEEAEALRLKNVVGLDQTQAAKEMNISQSSLQRILASAYKKVSEALIEGKTIKIIGNKF
jgi:predicted DNA-binding protein (UPF0251 family)